jgi:hypothetical protein
MGTNSRQKQVFDERLARIITTSGASFADRQAAPSYAARTIEMMHNARHPAGVLAAFILGLIAVFLVRFTRFQLGYGALTGDQAGMMMAVDLVLGVFIGYFLRQVFSFAAREFQLAHGLGVLLMVIGMHNIVHKAPAQFAQLFSDTWVKQLIHDTKPGTLLFRGISVEMEETQYPATSRANRPHMIVLDSERR